MQALINADEDATGAFKKLSYLLANPPYPPETFGNLLLLHCKYQNYDIAAGLLAENSNLTYKYLSQELYDYLDACIMVPTSIEEAYRKFDELSAKHIERLRKFTKQIQDARLARDSELIKTNLKLYDEDLEKYIPILMAQARIYWDRENYPMVEKLFFQVRAILLLVEANTVHFLIATAIIATVDIGDTCTIQTSYSDSRKEITDFIDRYFFSLFQAAEFCSEHEVWKLNVAHVFFMQETKFKDAIRYYDPIVKRLQESLVDVTAIVLANLCVSYIMTSQVSAVCIHSSYSRSRFVHPSFLLISQFPYDSV